MSKADEINRNNLVVASVGGVCQQHCYVPTTDPEILRCTECSMKTFATRIVATIERPKL